MKLTATNLVKEEILINITNEWLGNDRLLGGPTHQATAFGGGVLTNLVYIFNKKINFEISFL